jgi:mono/diheme cytochrome c family protein
LKLKAEIPVYVLRMGMALLLAFLSVSCRQQMADQPRYDPYEPSEFFSDGRSARPLVAGTVPRGTLQENQAFFTGKSNGVLVAELPLPITRELIERGRERYNISCTPCHDQVGLGNGMVVRRGFSPPPSFHTDRLRQAPNGHYFDVMTQGFGKMPAYNTQISPADRWAVVAYIRALQLSQRISAKDIPEDQRSKLEEVTYD